MTVTPDVPGALLALQNVLGPDGFERGGEASRLAGQDVFTIGAPVAAVVRPVDTAQIVAIVAIARRHGIGLVPRGAAMSYTRSVVAEASEQTVAVDMRAMALIREINVRDMYVVVEPGCSWSALADALAAKGLEVPYRGPVSGRLATIGGGVSHNAVFYGSGLFGTAADSVVGLEVVTGEGKVVRTGSWAVGTAPPFLRHFGPDMTGLFTGDCGAMGIKTAIVLRLRRSPALRDCASWQTDKLDRVFAFLEKASQIGIASQIIGMDVRLQAERIAQTGWRERFRHVAALFTGKGSLRRRLSQGATMARAGVATGAGARGYALHAFLEGEGEAECQAARRRIAALAEACGLAPAHSAVPQAMLREPFGPVTGLAGGKGERWVPVHFIVPHSRALDAMDRIRSVLSAHSGAMQRSGIKARILLANLGAGAVTIEPMFLWPDRLTDHARTTLIDQGGRADADAPRQAEAETVVTMLREALVEALDEIGSLHTQIGRHYPYLGRLGEGAHDLVVGMKRMLDPDTVMNPGVLGLP
ncbi:MAG: FAD-binding oxidoreductase [Sphingobium sp.]